MRLTAEQVIAGLTKRGVPAHTAQGVAMNFQDESGFETGIQEHEPTSGRGGFGLAQWTGPRRVQLENYAASKGVGVDDGEMQMDFFMQENATSEKAAWDKVLAAPDHRQAAASFVTNWERPEEGHRANRSAKYLNGAPDASTAYSIGTEVPVSPTMSFQGEERPDEVEGPSFTEQYRASFGLNTTARSYDYAADFINDQQSFKKDDAWVKNGPGEDRQLEDLKSRNLDPEVYANYIGGSTSQRGYARQLQNAVDDNARRALLARGGLTGTALELFNTTLGDPLQLAVDVATTAVAPQFTIAKYGVRVGRVLSKVVAGGLAGASTSALGYALNPNGEAGDILFGVGMGMGVGSLVGAMGRKMATGPESQQLQRLAQRTTAEYEGVPFIPKGNLGAAGSPTHTFMNPENPLESVKLSDTPDAALARNASEGGGGMFRTRYDLSARFNTSGNGLTKGMGHALVSEGVGMVTKVKDGAGKVVQKIAAINGRAASEEAENLKLELRTGYFRTYKAQLAEHFKEQGTNRRDKFVLGVEENKFNDSVDAYMRDTASDRAARYSKPVQVTGDRLAKQYAEFNKLQANPWAREGKQGRPVFGHEGIPDNVNYAPREIKSEKVLAIHHELEAGTIERLIHGAAKSANPDFPDDVLARFAKGYTKAITDRAAGLTDDSLSLLSGNNLEELTKVFNNIEGMPEDGFAKLDEVMARFKAKGAASDAGRDTHQRHRSLLDETYALPAGTVRTRHGVVDEQGLSIRDLLNTNATQLFQRYSTRASGNIALARVRLSDGAGNLVVDGITSDNEWKSFLDNTSKWGAANKVPPAQTTADIENLQFAYDSIKGRQVDKLENTEAGFLLRNVRRFNFMRIMNQSGFAALPELGHIVAQTGLKASYSTMPSLWKTIRNGHKLVEAGELRHVSQFADDFEATFGTGAERLNRFSTSDSIDAMRATIDDESGAGWRSKVDNVTERGTYITADMSGLAGINQISQRWAGRAILQNFANMSAGRTAMMSTKRLLDIGIDKGMANRVMAEIRLGKVLKMDGTKVAGLAFENAVDKEAAQALRNAVNRKVNQIIQKNDIGNLMPFMSRATGKMIMQFRSFMAGAVVKQTYKTIHMNDTAAYMSLVIGATIAAGGYYTRSQLQALGMNEQERRKYLYDEKTGKLTTGNLAAATFGSIGFSSIMPMMYDTFAQTGLYEPRFNKYRTTGQGSDIFANPTGTLVTKDIFGAVRGAKGVLDGDFGQPEVKAITKMLPFMQAMPFLQFNNALINDLSPDRSHNDWIGN
jgi:hypothetical protein